jgi:hypothetical protein
MIAYEPSQSGKSCSIASGTFNTCNGSYASETGWLPANATGIEAMLLVQPGSTASSCNAAVTDGTTTPTVDHGLASVSVLPLVNWSANGSCLPSPIERSPRPI